MSKSIFFKALKWSTAAEIASKVVQPVIFIALARLLTPEDYGVMAAAIMITSLTQILCDAGMSKALIQRQNDIEECASIAFWINLGFALMYSTILFFMAGPIANAVFHDVRVVMVLKWMTIQIILGALGSVHTALLQKKMGFKSLFWVRLASVAIPGLCSIPLAIYGFSYWALVAGTLVGQFMQVVILWSIYRWTPQFKFNVSLAKELGAFGLWVSLTGLLVWFYLWADSLVIGAYLGPHDLGLFRTGNMFVIMIFDGVLFGPILPVLYSYFSSLKQDMKKVSDVCSKIIMIIALIGIPLSFILYALADPISTIIFGNKWEGIASVIAIIGIMRGFGWLAGINGDTYRAIGKPQLETFIYAFSSVFLLAGFLVSIKFGFRVFLISRFLLGMFTLIPHFILLKKLVDLQLPPIFKMIFVCTLTGVIPIAINLIPWLDAVNLFLRIAIVSVSSAGCILFVLLAAERKFILSTFSELKALIVKSEKF